MEIDSNFIDYVVWVWKEPDDFTQHIVSRVNDDQTLCGINRLDLPDERGADPGDKPWYYDHDRKDVQGCLKCRTSMSLDEQAAYDDLIQQANCFTYEN